MGTKFLSAVLCLLVSQSVYANITVWGATVAVGQGQARSYIEVDDQPALGRMFTGFAPAIVK